MPRGRPISLPSKVKTELFSKFMSEIGIDWAITQAKTDPKFRMELFEIIIGLMPKQSEITVDEGRELTVEEELFIAEVLKLAGPPIPGPGIIDVEPMAAHQGSLDGV